MRGDCWCLKHLPGLIIGINDSALYLPRCDVAVSMDRLWTENRWDWLCGRKIESYIRVAALKSVPFTKDTSWLHPFECDYKSSEFSTKPGILNGTNSGLVGFNLAYTMMPEVIFLFGFDLRSGPNGEKYWHPDHPWGGGTKPKKLVEWSKEFHTAAKQCRTSGIRVINCSSRSLIADFEKRKPTEVLQ